MPRIPSYHIEMNRSARSLFKQYVMPAEHGGWFLWMGPFLLGSLAGWHFDLDLFLLLLLIVAGYLSRQPLIMLVKSLTGRRARADALPALQIFGLIALAAALPLGLLLLRGHTYLLWLGLPAVPVLALQLYLVSRRQERQTAIELVGSAVLALAAPAAYWVSRTGIDTTGWWLWALSWLYNASAVVYVYLRLRQRRWMTTPDLVERFRQAITSLLYAGFNLGLSIVLAFLGLIPPLAMAAYLFALLHYIFGASFPAIRARPVRIGIEQSSATLLFYVLLAAGFLHS